MTTALSSRRAAAGRIATNLAGGPLDYVRNASGAANYATHLAQFAIAGDIEIVARIRPDDWAVANAAIVSRYVSGKSWKLNLVAGALVLGWSETNSVDLTATSTATVPFANGTTGWVKATMDVDNGLGNAVITFYTATNRLNEPTVWTQLGTPITRAVTSIYTGGTGVVIAGAGGGTALAGRLYFLVVRNGIGGTPALIFDAKRYTQPVTPTTYVEKRTWPAPMTWQVDPDITFLPKGWWDPASIDPDFINGTGDLPYKFGFSSQNNMNPGVGGDNADNGNPLPALASGPYFFQPYGAGQSLVYSASSTSFASGDRTCRIFGAGLGASPGYVLAGQDGTVNGNFFTIQLTSATNVRFTWKDSGGTLVTRDVTIPSVYSGGSSFPSTATAMWIEGALKVNNGASGHTCTVRTSTDGINWTQIGQTITAGVTTCVPVATTVSVGGSNTQSDTLQPRFMKGQFFAGYQGGVLEAEFDANQAVTDLTTVIGDRNGSLHGIWTFTRAATGYPALIAGRSPSVLCRDPDFFYSNINGVTDLGTATPATYLAIARPFEPVRTNGVWCTTTPTTGTPKGITIRQNGAAASLVGEMTDGTTTVRTKPVRYQLNKIVTAALIVTPTQFYLWVDGVTSAAVNRPAGAVTGGQLSYGARAATARLNPTNLQFFQMLTYVRALDTEELWHLAELYGQRVPWSPRFLNPLKWYDAHLSGNALTWPETVGGANPGVTGNTSGVQATDAKYLSLAAGEDAYHYQPTSTSSISYSANATALAGGDRTVRVCLALDDWTTTGNYFGTGGNGETFTGRLISAGGLMRCLWVDSSAVLQTRDITLTANLATVAGTSPLWVEIALDVDNGASGHTVACRTSPDGVTWTNRGSTVTAGVSSHTPISSLAVSVAGGNGFACTGKVYAGQLMAGFQGGTVEVDYDGTRWAHAGSTTLADTVGSLAGTWTINRPTAGVKAVIVASRAVYMFGNGTIVTLPVAAVPPMDVADKWTIVAVCRYWPTPANTGFIVDTRPTSGKGTAIYTNGTLAQLFGFQADAAAHSCFTAALAVSTGARHVVALTCTGRGATGLQLSMDAGAPVVGDNTAVLDSRSANTVTIGGTSSAGGNTTGKWEGELDAIITFNRALTRPELALINDYYRAGV